MPFTITQTTTCDTPEALAQFICYTIGDEFCTDCPLCITGYCGCLKHDLNKALSSYDKDRITKEIIKRINKCFETGPIFGDGIHQTSTINEIK